MRGVIDTKWRLFKDQGDEWEKEHPNDLYHLDLEGSEPVLYLNAKYTKFRAALHETRETGRDAVIRYLGNTGVAHGVWLQLFMSAVLSLETDEQGDVRDPNPGWRQEAIALLTTHMFGGIDKTEKLRRLYDMRSTEQADSLLPWLCTVAQTMAKTGVLVNRAISAAEDLVDESGDQT
jgi:hypothetical protein